MDKPMPSFGFRLMSLAFRFRDLFLAPIDILKEVGIKPGFHVLDYGCGPGSYTIAAAQLVSKSGKIYALDIHPMAIKQVQNTASKKRLTNIETILSDCKTGLPDKSIDVALLFDTLHGLSEPNEVLAELHRVLKPNGILSLSDHHLKEDEIRTKITDKGLFRLLRKGERQYTFFKEE